jgi:hypothetical protein
MPDGDQTAGWILRAGKTPNQGFYRKVKQSMREFQRKEPAPSIIVDLRIPGRWKHPKDLIACLPDGCRATPGALILPNGIRTDLGFLPSDGQFPGIFRSSCRLPPKRKELATLDGYTVNVTISGEGGSMEAARRMLEAGAAVVRAGGAGVFIDNSALAHGGGLWLEMTEDGGPDALSFAFAGIFKDETAIWTVGMHVMGFRDIVMCPADLEDDFDVVEVIRYLVRSNQPAGDCQVLTGVNKSWYSCRAEEDDPRMSGTPMCNPFGRYHLAKLRTYGGHSH